MLPLGKVCLKSVLAGGTVPCFHKYLYVVTSASISSVTKPTIELNVQNGGKTKGPVRIKISGGTALCGIQKYQYSYDGVTWKNISMGVTNTISTKGKHTVKARAVNTLGATGEYAEVSFEIVEDTGVDPNPGGEEPGGEQPGGEQPGGEQPGGETPGGQQPGQNPGGSSGNSGNGSSGQKPNGGITIGSGNGTTSSGGSQNSGSGTSNLPTGTQGNLDNTKKPGIIPQTGESLALNVVIRTSILLVAAAAIAIYEKIIRIDKRK